MLARTVPGYSESSQTMNTLGETLRGRVPLRLFDGIPQSTPMRDGSRNGAFTDMDAIGRIEVINGPSAAEGIGAAGGIINYISKTRRRARHESQRDHDAVGSQFDDDSDSWKGGVEVAHKPDAFDVLFSALVWRSRHHLRRQGRRIGLSASSSRRGFETQNLFLKVGTNFGADESQRLQFAASNFKLEGKGNYHWVEGSRALRHS